MPRPNSYRELIVWQKAMKLARELCKATEEMPGREAYGMAEQMRRAAVSIPSNIAEGYGRLSDPQFRHFLGNARAPFLSCKHKRNWRLIWDIWTGKKDLSCWNREQKLVAF